MSAVDPGIVGAVDVLGVVNVCTFDVTSVPSYCPYRFPYCPYRFPFLFEVWFLSTHY